MGVLLILIGRFANFIPEHIRLWLMFVGIIILNIAAVACLFHLHKLGGNNGYEKEEC